MKHRLIVEEVIENCYCSWKDMPDVATSELRHMGLPPKDYKKCMELLPKIIKGIQDDKKSNSKTPSKNRARKEHP